MSAPHYATHDAAADAVAIADHVVAVLGRRIYRAARETALQDGIEQVLREHAFRVEREFRLASCDRPDFLIDGCVVVEVKMRASGSSVLAQLARYAAQRVKALVVATPRLSSLSGMPAEIFGVPVRVVALPGPGLVSPLLTDAHTVDAHGAADTAPVTL
ncbi:GxxExxY protein [Mycobacterium sp. 1245852.3]|uniref:GxxExxY protein n=1 Tax=Mycobacterium sp. 1245852.3 TaxID=1856860 RepID=UPI000A74D94D|nr:GxxExxY protein [Mycobacterium sp. 1245852.3]